MKPEERWCDFHVWTRTAYERQFQKGVRPCTAPLMPTKKKTVTAKQRKRARALTEDLARLLWDMPGPHSSRVLVRDALLSCINTFGRVARGELYYLAVRAWFRSAHAEEAVLALVRHMSFEEAELRYPSHARTRNQRASRGATRRYEAPAKPEVEPLAHGIYGNLNGELTCFGVYWNHSVARETVRRLGLQKKLVIKPITTEAELEALAHLID